MKIFFTLFLLYISINSYSKHYVVDDIPKLDSLLTVFESHTSTDSIRIKTALDLAWLYRNISPDNSYLYAKIAEDLSHANHYYHDEIRAISFGGIALRNRGEYQNAMNMFMNALEKSTTFNHNEDEGYAHINIASVNIYQGNYNEAVIHLELAEVLCNKLNDNRMLGYVLTNYGRVYFGTRLYTKAVNSFNEALSLRKSERDLYGQIVTYSDMGTVYAEIGNFPEALKYLQLALDLNEKNNEDADTMVGTLIDMARIYRKTNDYVKATKFAQKASEIAVDIRAKHMALNSFLELKTIERAKGRYKKALEYDDLIESYKDSIFNEEIRLKLAEINVRYLVAQREKENELLKKDKEINEIIIERHSIISFGAFVLIIVLSLFVYFLNRENKQKKVINHTLHLQKSELEVQSKEIQRINDLLQAKSQDIMDSINYAKGIQKAILPSWNNVKQFIPNSFVFFEPRDIVSGDFYWFKNINEKMGILIAADCTGHGVPGGFMSMVGETALEYIVDSQQVYYPSKILEELHARLSSILRQKKSGNMDGMDVSVCLIDKEKGTVQYAGAGMSMTIVENHKHQNIKGSTRGVGGVSSFTSVETHTFEFSRKSMFYIYSDGYADQFGGSKGKKLKSPNFRKILEACSRLPLKDQKQFLKIQFDSWKQDEDQVDDVMIIGFTN